MSDFDIKFVRCHAEAKIPVKAYDSDGNAGVDLCAVEYCEVLPLQRRVISTGLKIQIPKGYFGRICPRSGLAVKSGIMTMAGIIDPIYTGEIKVVLYNSNFQMEDLRDFLKPSPFTQIFGQRNRFMVNPGDKIAQIIFEKYYPPSFIEVNSLDDTVRGEKGFGSSDKS